MSQQAWIQNATVRDNILFGSRYNKKRYERVIAACELKRDFEILEAGDQTEIGEKVCTFVAVLFFFFFGGGEGVVVVVVVVLFCFCFIITINDKFKLFLYIPVAQCNNKKKKIMLMEIKPFIDLIT